MPAFNAKPSSHFPNRSSDLPKCSSNFPKCSRSAQLEPFPGEPIFTTISRQTTYNFAAEKTASDLSAKEAPAIRPESLKLRHAVLAGVEIEQLVAIGQRAEEPIEARFAGEPIDHSVGVDGVAGRQQERCAVTP